ncbi:MAG: PilX N-terminal domain-containing pilus assembly protein [Desulfobacterales bacterium]|nr:PilX N-terminal domain-containing pilus assembly protein [Desulfobacterales bacterium]
MKFSRLLKTARNEKGMVLAIAIILLSVLVVVGFTAAILTSTDSKISSNYRENQRALYNAEAGVETVLAYLRSTTVTYPTSNADAAVITANTTCSSGSCTQITVAPPSGFTSANFFGHTSGNNTVNIYGKDVTNKLYVFRMTGTGNNSASKTIEVYVTTKFQLNEGVDGALSMLGSNPTLDGNGNGAIDGNDHSLPPTNCSGSSCHTAADGPGTDKPGLFSTHSVTKLDGGIDITGNPAEVLNTSADAATKDVKWTAFANDIVNSGAYDSTFSSDRNAPKITVLTSYLKLSGNVHYYGIIVVSGVDVEIETVGTFTFEGLIILANGATLTTKGTANTYGSVITCSHSELTVTMSGTPTFMYSSEAISNLGKINAPHAARKTAWRDVS